MPGKPLTPVNHHSTTHLDPKLLLATLALLSALVACTPGEVTPSPFTNAGLPLEVAGADPVGSHVAISEQYVVVGGEEYVHVFENLGDGWQEMQKLVASDAAAGADFGSAVAIDGETIIVGAPGDAQYVVNGGAAYIFELSAGSWTEVVKLTDPLPETGDSFGEAVSILGGYAAVGASGDAQDSVASGSVFMYQRSEPTGWSLLAKLRPPAPEPGDQFGVAVDLGAERLIVGSPNDPLRGNGAGTAHVFNLNGFVWEHETELAPEDLEALDRFGKSVAISGDHLLVGAPHDAAAEFLSGATYTFSHDGTGWQQTDTLFAETPAVQDFFGNRLDLDYPYAVVGVVGHDEPVSNAGSVIVYRHDGASWQKVAGLSSPSPVEDAFFGQDVAIAGEFIAASQLNSPPAAMVFKR